MHLHNGNEAKRFFKYVQLSELGACRLRRILRECVAISIGHESQSAGIHHTTVPSKPVDPLAQWSCIRICLVLFGCLDTNMAVFEDDVEISGPCGDDIESIWV